MARKKSKCEKHRQAAALYQALREGEGIASILRWLDPPISRPAIQRYRDLVMKGEIKPKSDARPSPQQTAEMVPAQQLSVQPQDQVPTLPSEPAFPPEIEPQRLAAVRRRVELAERFYEERALTVHEVQLGAVREVLRQATDATCTPAERAKFTEQAVKLLNAGALERSLGEAASYSNVQRSQAKQSGGRSLVDMHFVVMPSSQVPTNHTLPRPAQAPLEITPAKE